MLRFRSPRLVNRGLGLLAVVGGIVVIAFFGVWLVTGANWAVDAMRIVLGSIALISSMVGLIWSQYGYGSRRWKFTIGVAGLVLCISVLF